VFDKDLEVILQSTLQGRVERKINTLTTIKLMKGKVYSMGLGLAVRERTGYRNLNQSQTEEKKSGRN